MDIAHQVARRATCPVRQVGAVFVDSDTHAILSMGYNGAPRKTSHCGDACRTRKQGENSELCKAVHAEMNAILNAALNGIALKNCTVYSTLSPCIDCARALVQVGVKTFIFDEESPYVEGLALLSEAKIMWFQNGVWGHG